MKPTKEKLPTHTKHDQHTAVPRTIVMLKGREHWPLEPVSLEVSGLVHFRLYQWPVFSDQTTGILVLHWARQIGKSFTLAAWAVDRLITRPGRLVTVLSNSRENGAEFLRKCAEICELNQTHYSTSLEDDAWLDYESMRLELHIIAQGRTGRIKVLAANARTARGFTGDLILDEFAFHEDPDAIWEAVEPILSSNKDYLCRIASTGNGAHNLFHHLAQPVVTAPTAFEGPAIGGICMGVGRAGYRLSRVPRSIASQMGVEIFDAGTRKTITPAMAREQALDKRAYDQNYECTFDRSNRSLLTQELINAAERPGVGIICEQNWSNAMAGSPNTPGEAQSVMEWLRGCNGPLYAGFDVARKVDLSVISVMERIDRQFFVRAILRMEDVRLPEQQQLMEEICRLPRFRRAAIDMTGMGFALVEHLQAKFPGRIQGINFSSTVPLTRALEMEGRKQETVRVTEALALELLQAYEERRIQHPADTRLRDDLCKPERITTPGGRVSIAATRDEAGHADHFWSFALALEAAATAPGKFSHQALKLNAGRLL